ncbi:hypothetical protein SMKI_04G5150 [Saccharomyces mikatae IFO 1815]|uniref:Rad34p n=1 Tax=Saccharomyces mikatae IFO 1815 TaxID=226126 RepID=A0AA35NHF9_SACMI|nr:uncharacterized protein SMKI_04G5150 [Saccharomyces mikatae IFO 1815]CAI4038175.1 hypothetical protein SMKI_04G5150 [Saccharomyces mikatae IFO 1815]
MSKRVLEPCHHHSSKQKKSKNGEKELLFYEEEGEVDSFDDFHQDEDDNLSDVDWEDVCLDGSITVTVNGTHRNSEKANKPKRKNDRKAFNYQRLKYGLHLVMMPFMLFLLKTRVKCVDDERLNRRLRRSVPKLISKKFKDWNERDPFAKMASLRTLLLGLVLWFRSNYKMNSNGIRQNFNRLQYLIKYADSQNKNMIPKSTYKKVLDNQHEFYGNRPLIKDNVEDLRKMAKKKMANRDILTLFFLIILKNLLPENKKLYFCFALPLHDYAIRCNKVKWQIEHDVGKVPNLFDSDLIQPYFWIELEFPTLTDNELYIIDPIAHLDKREMVLKTRKDQFVPNYQPSTDMKYNLNQSFHYVVNIDCTERVMYDISPRYVPNVCYRYFELSESSPILRSKHYRSYQNLSRWLKIFNKKRVSSHNDELMKNIALTNFTLPKSVIEIKRTDNFVIPSILKSNEVLNPQARQAATFTKVDNLREPLFWKKDVLQLKSKQHWAILGRSILPDTQPLKRKKYLPMKKRLVRNLDKDDIKELFSYEQTMKTPKYPNTYHDLLGHEHMITNLSHFKNKFGNIEIYSKETKPDGFELIPLNECGNIKDLIKRYNRTKRKTQRIEYLDVVSGFDFKQKKGHAIPKIESILVKESDYELVQSLKQQTKLLLGLSFWDLLLRKLQVNDRLNTDYGNLRNNDEMQRDR